MYVKHVFCILFTYVLKIYWCVKNIMVIYLYLISVTQGYFNLQPMHFAMS